MTYIDICRKRIAALDGTTLTPAERGEMRAIARSRQVPDDVAAAAAALSVPTPPEATATAGFKRGQRLAAEAAAASRATYPILGN